MQDQYFLYREWPCSPQSCNGLNDEDNTEGQARFKKGTQRKAQKDKSKAIKMTESIKAMEMLEQERPVTETKASY